MSQELFDPELQKELDSIEERAGLLMTVRELFDAGFKAGLESAGLTSHSDTAYENWLWDRE